MYSKTQRRCGSGAKGSDAADPLGADHHDLAGLDLAHEFRVDDVEGAGFRREDPRVAKPAEHQRAHPERVAHADQRLLRQRHQRVRPLDLTQCVGQAIDDAVLEARRDQVDDDLGVAGRLKDAAAPHQLPAQLVRVRQVAVVADREAAEIEIGEQRLNVAQRDLAGRRIADMPDRRRTRQTRDDVLRAEIVADQTGAAMRAELVAVIGDDAGRLLAAMLQGVQAERGQRRRVLVPVDPENTAFLVETIRFRAGRQHPHLDPARSAGYTYMNVPGRGKG